MEPMKHVTLKNIPPRWTCTVWELLSLKLLPKLFRLKFWKPLKHRSNKKIHITIRQSPVVPKQQSSDRPTMYDVLVQLDEIGAAQDQL